MAKCKYCGREATRSHARHDTAEIENLCELHYAKWHPTSVLSTLRDKYPWRIKDRKAFLDELRKYVDSETIDKYLGEFVNLMYSRYSSPNFSSSMSS